MVEEKKEEEKKEEVKAEEKKEEKKEAPPEIVLKVDMHFKACARKVARTLRGVEGVERVIADVKSSKVVVKGKTADPQKVFMRLQKKSGRKVELISPLPKPPEENKDDKKDEPKEDKKEEPPAVVTVVLNVRMHCEACAQGLKKRVRKIKGVESVETNLANSQMIVKGVVDPTKLVDDVCKKTGKQAFIVKGEEKKEEEKKEENEGKKEEGEEETKGESDNKSVDLIKRSKYWPSKSYFGVCLCS